MSLQDLIERGKAAWNGESDVGPIPDDISELDDDRAPELPPDPKPNKRGASTVREPKSTTRVTAGLRREVKERLTAYLTMLSLPLALKDPVCGGSFMDNAENIADKLTVIVVRNPTWMNWVMGGGGDIMDWIALGQAMLPVGRTVWENHVTGSHDDDREPFEPDYSGYHAPAYG